MNSFLLRVEGVNLSNFVYDTTDLPTIRGGGLILLRAPGEVQRFLGAEAKVIEEGASKGLFRITSARNADEIRQQVAGHLSKWNPHATFVVDLAEDVAERERAQRNEVLARNRWRQMQAGSVVYPDVTGVRPETPVCPEDLVRPATARGGKMSESVASRRDRGDRNSKREFYQQEIHRVRPEAEIPEFTETFDELCGESGSWGNLRDKMAVIYIDGNKVGDFVNACERHTELRDFNNGLRDGQAHMLANLVDNIRSETDWQNYSKVRLETLLWGGDEILWAVPAWKGWELLRSFFTHWASRQHECWKPLEVPLTWSAGLVFCHQKAPIQTTTKLARRLASKVKEGAKYKNRFLYQVLESFDHVKEPDAGIALAADDMEVIGEHMRVLREEIPRRKLYQILKTEDVKLRAEIEKDIRRGLSAAGPALDQLERMAGAQKKWNHIAELWDYVVAERIEA